MVEHFKRSSLVAAAMQDNTPCLQQLPPCERALAAIVYRKKAVTALELCAELSGRLSNGAVRTMLTRLMRKGVLRRHRSGYGKTFLYVPADHDLDICDIAFRRLAEDYFEGCLVEAASAMQGFLESRSRSQSEAA